MKIHKIISLIIITAVLSSCGKSSQIVQESENSNSTEEVIAASSVGVHETISETTAETENIVEASNDEFKFGPIIFPWQDKTS